MLTLDKLPKEIDLYVEKYGIILHGIQNGRPVYYANYFDDVTKKPYTYKIELVIDLTLDKVVEKRTRLNRMNRKGFENYLL